MSENAAKRFSRSLSVLLAAAFVLASGSALSADLERGRTLHENHCRMCHDSVAYKRDKKLAATYAEVRAQVVRWQSNTSLRWTEEDIGNVTAYLAKTYYKIPCPDC